MNNATEKEMTGAKAPSHHEADAPDASSLNKDVEKQKSNDDPDSGGSKEPSVKNENIVDWEGPDDPENPLNWAPSKKVFAIGVIALITFLSPFASTITAPATELIMREFGSTSSTLGAFITSVYLLGYVCGPLVLAPLSELYGRSIVYHICNFLFLIWTIACALAPNLSALIVFRLFQGVGASCAVTIGAGSIADMIVLEKRGAAMAWWIMGPVIGPTVGPLVGSYLGEAKGWRWIFWLLSILGGFVFLVALVCIQESYPYTILDRKTKRLRKETVNPNLKSALDTGKSPADLFKVSIFRPLKMLFLSPIVFFISLYMSMVYSYIYLLFTTFPRVFQGTYGFSDSSIGLVYIGSGVGCLIGLFICGATSDRVVKFLVKRNGGVAKPEYRLPVSVIGAIIIPAGLFIYAWTAANGVHWIVPIIGTSFVSGGMFFIFMPSSTYLVDAFTIYAASAMAAATVLRSICAAFLPLAGNSMYDALGVGWGNSLLGFIAFAFMPIPLVFIKFGERIRKSKWGNVQF